MPRGRDDGGRDLRGEFAAASSAQPVDQDFRRRFLANRRRVARSHALAGADARHRALEDLSVLGEAVEYSGADAPVPGGVGYGMFYAPSFKEGFVTGTAIYWEIVCPQTAGGNVSNYLYVTATNRSALGVEALIAYHAQEPMRFVVFDWALLRQQKDPWALDLPLGTLGPYLHRTPAHGAEYAVLALRNMTFELSGNVWVNQVSLLNAQTNAWDVAYQFQYAALPAEQHGTWPGSWGPIVETFEAHYQGTNPMGALNTQISQASDATWTAWTPLMPDNAQLRADNTGLLPVFLDPNASWVVAS
jgi:hypothetical protein